MSPAFRQIAPYAAWMVLMGVLPQTAAAYAVRGLVTAVFLAAGRWRLPKVDARAFAAALGTGVLVFLVWILPEFASDRLRALASSPSPYAPQVCGWPLTVVRLLASAFVISAAEELFFRKWLVGFAGFWWTVALFAVEHLRADLGPVLGCVFVLEGAFAGVAYGLLARRFGLFAAIVAHAATNLLLGLYVVLCGRWFYW